MGVPQSLLNILRKVNADYFLSNKVKLYKYESFTDEYGGTYTDYVLSGEFPARFVHDTYKEQLIGGNIEPRDEYRFVFDFLLLLNFRIKSLL